MLIHVLLSSLLRATKHYSRYQVLLRKLQWNQQRSSFIFSLIQVSVSVNLECLELVHKSETD